MLLSEPDIRFCLSEAENIAHIYQLNVLNSQATRKSLDGLLELFPAYIERSVVLTEFLELPHEGNSIRGFCLTGADKYEICLLSGMNFCWRRFVTCKEIFHVILDAERYQTTNIYGHLEEVIAKFPVPVLAGPAVVSEALAEIAAMQFMFPYADRRAILENGVPDYRDIAEHYKIPQVLIEEYLVDSFVNGLEPYMQKKAI